MGHSLLDPAFQEFRPWNEGRVLSAKRALKRNKFRLLASGSTSTSVYGIERFSISRLTASFAVAIL
jgi:hypothetical protein